MIGAMRKYMKTLNIFLWAVVGSMVLATFYIYGRGTITSDTGGPVAAGVAVVNGETIPFERYERLYQAYVNRYSQIYKDRFTPAMAERLGLRQQAVNDLVLEALIVQRAKAEGFGVTDEELNAQIQAIPAFRVNGVFSLRAYQEFLGRRRTTPAAFEADVRRDLARIKIENAVKDGAKVTDAEVEQAFRYRQERVRAAWALVDVSALMARTPVTDAEVAAFLKDNPAQFQRPERRRVQYVLVDAKDWVKSIGQAEVERYYKEHRAEFETPHEVRVAHVLIRVPETGGSAAEDKARARAEDVIRRAKAGEDFARLAKEFSEDPGTVGKGGEVGWIAKGQVVPQFEEVAFALKKAEVSPKPVRTQFGFHVVKVLDVREGGLKPLTEVAPLIRARLINERIGLEAMAKATEIRPKLQAAKDFAAEARQRGFEARDSIINKPSATRGLTRNDALQAAAFDVAIGGVSEPIQTPAGVVILKVIQHISAGVPPLADIKDEVTNALKRQKGEAVAAQIASRLAEAARGGDLEALARKERLQAGQSQLFSRAQPTDRIPPEAMLAALQTPVGKIAAPVKTPQGVYVVKTLERVPPDPLDFAKEREQMARELLEAKRSQAWERWVLATRENAKIELTGKATSRG